MIHVRHIPARFQTKISSAPLNSTLLYTIQSVFCLLGVITLQKALFLKEAWLHSKMEPILDRSGPYIELYVLPLQFYGV